MKTLIKAAALLLIFVLGESAAQQGNLDKPAGHHSQSSSAMLLAANDRDRDDDRHADQRRESEARKKKAEVQKREAENRKKAEDRKRDEDRRKAEREKREQEKKKGTRRVCKVTGHDKHGNPIKKCHNQSSRSRMSKVSER